jgi:tight adherence protein C
MLIYAAVIFVLVTLASLALMSWLLPSQGRKRLQELELPGEKTDWLKTAVGVASPLAKLSIPEGDWENSTIRIKFINAGIRNVNAPILFYAAKTVLPLFLAGAGYLGMELASVSLERNQLIFVLLILATIGCYLPNILLDRVISARKREIFENFPDAADLMLVCVEAGLGLDAAMVKVADEMKVKSGALTEELHLTNLETRAGSTREQALRNLGLRTGVEEISAFVSMLTQADKFGTSVGESLRVFSEDLRHKRQMRAEELAAKLSTKMLFPLVLCIFPAISMVVLAPAGVRIVRVLLPMLGGQH